MFAASGALGGHAPSRDGPATTLHSTRLRLLAKPSASLAPLSAHPSLLIAEELFASGCRFLLSLTSAGQITPAGPPPYFVIIDRALRDEGTSYHYAAPSAYGEADTRLVATAVDVLKEKGLHAVVGSSWTTDAPFRETAEAIEAARSKGVLAVEMEAAALYTFARTTGAKVLCLAHVTNAMGRLEQDFEKGEADGTADALQILEAIVRASDL